MNINLKNIWVLILIGALGWSSYVYGLCGVTESCARYQTFGKYSLTVFEPILIYSMTVVPLALILLFTPDATLRKWLRFSTWWIPLSILVIALAKTNGNSWMPLYPEATKENLAWFMGGLFTILSIRLIVREHRKIRAASERRTTAR